jgi:endonuclease/exonuclease/phosphatase family metal-dependent hydrolase
MMQFTILNWNIGGAKFLEDKIRKQRDETRRKLNMALRGLIHSQGADGIPDVITLQEIVQYKEPDDDIIQDLLDPIDGYWYYPFTLIDTNLVSSRAKWNKVLKDSDWHPDTFFSQGNAFLVRENSPIFPVFDLSSLGHQSRANPAEHFVEHVHLDSGLYFGDRNTEPRAALVMHFICDPASKDEPGKPVDIFVVNLHLTTLMKEREGVPEIDSMATRTRLSQLDIVFNGIVSRYNSWRQDKYLDRGERREAKPHETFDRHSPVWILAGDFNFTEESDEYMYIKKRNFMDTVMPAQRVTTLGRGTKAKGVGHDPTLTLDYIFAGPKFVSLDPVIEEHGINDNKVIHSTRYRASDHYPVYSRIEFTPW